MSHEDSRSCSSQQFEQHTRHLTDMNVVTSQPSGSEESEVRTRLATIAIVWQDLPTRLSLPAPPPSRSKVKVYSRSMNFKSVLTMNSKIEDDEDKKRATEEGALLSHADSNLDKNLDAPNKVLSHHSVSHVST